jgi:hypothetical protein
MNDKITRTEPLRIRNIQRRLSTINEFYQDHKEKIHHSSLHVNLLPSVPNTIPCENRFHVRRKSTLA